MLGGCAKGPDTMQQALDFRASVLQSGGCRFKARITADYEEQVFQFTLDCAYSPETGAEMTIIEPQTLAGLRAVCTERGAQIEYDGASFGLGALGGGRLAPMELPLLLGQSWCGEYIAAAFEHDVALSTLLEASLRGIPTDQLEMKAGSDTLKRARVLGHGAANTVTLCVYRGENGEDVPLVFKPETAARQGFPDLTVYRLGYRAGARVMQINVAASRSADAAGCGDAVARSRIGVYDGHVGLFMEKAPGSTACDLMTGRPCVPDGRGNKLTLGQVVSGLKKKGLLDDMRANLMRELNRLEWADALSGQADRHYQNYLVDINPETGAVKVTGIDNVNAAAPAAKKYYDLQGRRVLYPAKGIFVTEDGQKVLFK